MGRAVEDLKARGYWGALFAVAGWGILSEHLHCKFSFIELVAPMK